MMGRLRWTCGAALGVLIASLGPVLAIAGPAGSAPRVDFSYSFGTPHRVTIGRPDSSDRTLLDLYASSPSQANSLRIAWSYDDLTRFPLAAFKTPPTAWDIRVAPQVDSHGYSKSRWSRLEGYLPSVENVYEDSSTSVQIEALGGITAALCRVTVSNRDAKPHQIVLRCDSAAWGENPAWVEPTQCVGDHLLAGWNDRADRVLMLGLGAETYSLQPDGRAAGPKTLLLIWNLKAGEQRAGWLVRPYRAYAADLPNLRRQDWTKEWAEAKQEWLALLRRTTQVEIPDPGVANAYRACLADLFIMREPVAEGHIAAVPGTEVYRAPNAFEAAVVAVALDQVGLHKEAASGYRWCLEMQEPDGNWADLKGWGHLMWGNSGFKGWAAMEHYRLAGDRDFLSWVYPRLAASSRWQEKQRARMRAQTGSERPLAYGLMPRGMGDCGLMDDGDLYGIFLPHNIWAVYADRLSVEAAEILGRTEDLAELKKIYETGLKDLLAALDRGAIREKDYRWMPGVPGKTSGSRWGVLNALFPCRLLPPNHELIVGTLRQVESQMSPGGIPIHTGWMADGMWVAITLDNIAEAHLARGNGDAAAKYLYATLNHGTPLHTWCEERGQEPGTGKCSGDRQHLWTPVAVVRAVRDCLVMEDGDALNLALGTERSWLASGKPLAVANAPTHFGPVSYRLQYDAASARVTGEATFPEKAKCARAVLHVRLPGNLRVKTVNESSGATIQPDGSGLCWKSPQGVYRFEASVVKP